jgi:hypothetical protein
VRDVTDHVRSGKGLLFVVTRLPAHFRIGIPFSRQPRRDGRRHLMHVSRLEVVETNAVELRLDWRFLDSDLHLTHLCSRSYT